MKRSVTTRKNLFGFGRKAEPRPSSGKRSSATIGAATTAAYAAGQRSGDTWLFKSWLEDKGLDSRGNVLIERLRQAYERGVEAGEKKEEKKTAVKAKKAVRSAEHSGKYSDIPSEDALQDAYKRGAKSLSEALEMAGARMNPASESAKAFKDFHGKPVERFVEVKERIHTHGYLAAAGELRRLDVNGVDGWTHAIKFKGTLLAFNEKRNQLFVKGGDQSIDLKDYRISKPHELETLGQVTKIDYFTDKKHLGDEGGRAVYRHKFRTTNENGQHVTIRVARYPDLIYRVLEKRLEFSGGSYEILPEGIDR